MVSTVSGGRGGGEGGGNHKEGTRYAIAAFCYKEMSS
jgi:hypothetical protein